jgi:hypothetical protein
MMELYRTDSSSGYSGTIYDIYETEVPVGSNTHAAYTQIKDKKYTPFVNLDGIAHPTGC